MTEPCRITSRTGNHVDYLCRCETHEVTWVSHYGRYPDKCPVANEMINRGNNIDDELHRLEIISVLTKIYSYINRLKVALTFRNLGDCWRIINELSDYMISIDVSLEAQLLKLRDPEAE